MHPIEISLEPNPVIEAYKKDVDGTLLDEQLKLSHEQRVLQLIELQRVWAECERARREREAV